MTKIQKLEAVLEAERLQRQRLEQMLQDIEVVVPQMPFKDYKPLPQRVEARIRGLREHNRILDSRIGSLMLLLRAHYVATYGSEEGVKRMDTILQKGI